MIFITGGTGLLGSHVLVELLKRGKKIRALRRQSSCFDQTKAIFAHFFQENAELEFAKIEWVDGDILDLPSIEAGIQGCSTVYHCAGLVSFRKRDFKKLMKVNKEGTANMVNVSLAFGIDLFCHVSSTAAIGRSVTKTEYDETNHWVNTKENSNYAISKYSAENEVWRGKEEGLAVVIINPSVIFGVGDWNESSLSLLKVVKKGLKFYTSGTNAFVDARDVAYVFCELAERKIVNERFLTFSENLAYRDLFTIIAKAFEVKPPAIKVKPWMVGFAWRIEGLMAFFFGKKQNITKETARSSMATTRYSNDKLKSVLNFEFIPIEKCIEDAASFFKANTKKLN